MQIIQDVDSLVERDVCGMVLRPCMNGLPSSTRVDSVEPYVREPDVVVPPPDVWSDVGVAHDGFADHVQACETNISLCARGLQLVPHHWAYSDPCGQRRLLHQYQHLSDFDTVLLHRGSTLAIAACEFRSTMDHIRAFP